jgi:hypothetical protein
MTKEHTFDIFNYLYKKLDETIPLIAPARFHQLRFEDLICDPVGEMQALYENLGLGGFETVLPALNKYLASIADYQPNRFHLSSELREEIRLRCGRVIRKYGYSS